MSFCLKACLTRPSNWNLQRHSQQKLALPGSAPYPVVAHVLISAAHKSSGKTVLSTGISAALHDRGLRVQTFKKGPDYIDPMWMTRASRRNCYNLDFWTQTDEEISFMFTKKVQSADIGLVEGNKGLHDGLSEDGCDSNAALARMLKAPVILILDTRGTIRGVAPLVLGYQQFDPEVKIAGVILNFVGGERHAAKLIHVMEGFTDVPVIGTVYRNRELELVERYLGLMPSNEDQSAERHISDISKVVADQVDLDRISVIANSAPPLPHVAEPVTGTSNYGLRIAYARDEAFGFYYLDDLDTFSRLGVQMLPFDTLHDTSLPEADALFIGGGFPEKRMRELAANISMKQALREVIDQGMPVYAECGGLMYLCNAIRFGSERCTMVGVIDAECEMHEKPIGRGYTVLRKSSRHLWSDTPRQSIPGHEFHYSMLTNIAGRYDYSFEVQRGFGVNGKNDGIQYKNLLACYSHQRNTERNQWIPDFLDFIKSCF